MKHRFGYLFLAVLGLTGLGLIFNFTDPLNVGMILLIPILILIFCTSWVIFALLLDLAWRIGRRKDIVEMGEKTLKKMRWRATLLAIAPILLIVFRSPSGITFFQVLVIFFAEIVGWLAINRRLNKS
jgi:hypothetical protein